MRALPLLLLLAAASCRQADPPPPSTLILWAWERPEDLRSVWAKRSPYYYDD
jgi:hypothetical protein